MSYFHHVLYVVFHRLVISLCPLWWFNGSDWRISSTCCLSPSTSELRFTQQDGNKLQTRFYFANFLLNVCEIWMETRLQTCLELPNNQSNQL